MCERLRRLAGRRELRTDVGLALFAAAYFLMMHGMRRDMISPGAYRFAEVLRLLCCAVLLPALVLGLDRAQKRNWRMERVFLMLFVPLSLLMMLAMPVSRVPDELAHLQRAYLISDGQVLTGSGPVRYPANFFDWGDSDNALRLSQLAEQRDTEFSETQIEADSNMATGIYPVNSYFPQALAMAIARLFTRNRLVILYAARFGAWLVTLLLLYHAVRMAPEESQGTLVMVSLFPMTLQEAVSASADGMTIGVVACMAAFVLRARRDRRLLRAPDLVQMALLALGVVTFKVMYLPFLFMLLLIPRECFAAAGARRRTLTAVIAGALAVILAWAWLCKASYMSTGSAGLGSNILPQLAFVLRHPLNFLMTLMRTLSGRFGSFLMEMIGTSLSWFNLTMPSLLIYMQLLLFVAVCLRDMPARAEDGDGAVRAVTGVLSAAAALVVFLFLYVWWTEYQAVEISGIQGRYFTPVLFPALAAMQYRAGGKVDSLPSHSGALKGFAVLDMFVLMTVLIYTV